jgi:BlaI family penicillinase repressor
MSANQIVEILAETTNWKSKTVKTLLNRLVNKNALGFDKNGRTYYYYPIVTKTECARAERHSLLNRVYDGALQPMLAAFLKEEKLSSVEIEELKQILENKGENKS